MSIKTNRVFGNHEDKKMSHKEIKELVEDIVAYDYEGDE